MWSILRSKLPLITLLFKKLGICEQFVSVRAKAEDVSLSCMLQDLDVEGLLVTQYERTVHQEFYLVLVLEAC